MPLYQEDIKAEDCVECGDEIADWRKVHDDRCSECGPARCRRCGSDVTARTHTVNGGECQACAGPGDIGAL